MPFKTLCLVSGFSFPIEKTSLHQKIPKESHAVIFLHLPTSHLLLFSFSINFPEHISITSEIWLYQFHFFAMLFGMKPPGYSSCFSLGATGYQKATDCDVPKMAELLFPVMKQQWTPNFASMSFSKIG